MSKSKVVPATLVLLHGEAMTDAELKLGRDIKVSKSAKAARSALISDLIEQGRTLEDMTAPPKEANQAIWIDINALAFEAVGQKMSSKGSPDGKEYNIAALLEGSPTDQPDWVNVRQFGSNGDRTLRQHWQSQTGTWLRDVRASWQRRIAAETALSASPDERTRAFSVIKCGQLTKVMTSIQKQSDLSFDAAKACKLLREVISLIESS